VPLRPSQVHPHQHLGEVSRVNATGARADRDDRLALVVLAVEQGADLELAHRLGQAAQLSFGLPHGGRVALFDAELDQHLELVDAVVHRGDPLELGVGARQAAGDLLRGVRVVPQVRRPGLLLELADLGAQGVQIGHLPHRLHRRAKVLEHQSEVNSHEKSDYATPT